ncbi:MAG: hypothetical protein ACK5CY_00770 [Bacteroidia bacterium]|jgi:uncharacterized membrane protein YqaE (UPF0057 family)
MKTIKNLFYVCMAFTLVMSSCSMEKRAYRSGYHIDWASGKTKSKTVKSDVAKSSETAVVNTPSTSEVAVVEQNLPVVEQPVAIEENASASLENAIVVTPTAPKINFNRNEAPVKSEVSANPTSEAKQYAKKIKKEKGSKKPAKTEISKGLYIVLALLGWAWVAIGLMDDWKGSTWIISLLLYFCLWLPGVIYALIKMNKYY